MDKRGEGKETWRGIVRPRLAIPVKRCWAQAWLSQIVDCGTMCSWQIPAARRLVSGRDLQRKCAWPSFRKPQDVVCSVISDGVESYVADQEGLLAEVHQADRQRKAGHYVKHEDMKAWLLSWGTDKELPPPKCACGKEHDDWALCR